MDKQLIERLAKEAGFEVDAELAERHEPSYICGPGYEADNAAVQVFRFASMVAEECARIAEQVGDGPIGSNDGEQRAAEAIRKRFAS